MSQDPPAIEIDNLVRRYGRADAVNGLRLRVEPGRCYGVETVDREGGHDLVTGSPSRCRPAEGPCHPASLAVGA